MHSSLIAAALCILVQGAAAQCTASTATGTTSPAPQMTPVVAQPAEAPATRSGELIKTAAAGTRDAPVVHSPVRPQPGEDHPRRSGTAMLLTALALMSGIALRRFGGPRQ